MMCSRVVFRCFKALERLGDRITGAAGPFFVAFAVILINLGTLSVGVIMPGLMWPLVSGPICVLITLNLGMHYFYVMPQVRSAKAGASKPHSGPPRATLSGPGLVSRPLSHFGHALSTLHMADAPSRVPGWMPSRVAWRVHNWLPRGSQVHQPPYAPLLNTPRADSGDSLTGSQPHTPARIHPRSTANALLDGP
ncbi:hypothetical protein B0H14DRAFT_3495570 [Mycena olivaceomarginata]|nr:hypothetical protein B0H14DRAFT_3495570 [Mycena olivaceomarginata]